MKAAIFFDEIYFIIQNFLSYLTGGTVCIGCGNKTLAMPLCADCKKIVQEFTSFKNYGDEDQNSLELKRCRECGKILLSEIGTCSECRERTEARATVAYFPIHSYRLWKKDLIYRWKSEDVRTLSVFFSDLVFNAVKSLEKDRGLYFDSIIPVPPRPGKLKEKGWDQVDELCVLLKRRHGIKIEYPLVRYTKQEQKKLTREERKSSYGAEYGLKRNTCIEGKKVLILDDVITTGSTMEKCAVLLKKAGVKEVYGMSLFMVD